MENDWTGLDHASNDGDRSIKYTVITWLQSLFTKYKVNAFTAVGTEILGMDNNDTIVGIGIKYDTDKIGVCILYVSKYGFIEYRGHKWEYSAVGLRRAIEHYIALQGIPGNSNG